MRDKKQIIENIKREIAKVNPYIRRDLARVISYIFKSIKIEEFDKDLIIIIIIR